MTGFTKTQCSDSEVIINKVEVIVSKHFTSQRVLMKFKKIWGGWVFPSRCPIVQLFHIKIK